MGSERPRSSFFNHRDCEHFPCHLTDRPEDFNCLFCYCPLYTLGPDCGGNFTYTAKGTKNCKACILPHSPEGYDYIRRKFHLIAELAREKREGIMNAEF